MIRLTLLKLNLSSVLKLSTMIKNFVILNSASMEDQIIGWNQMYVTHNMSCFSANTNKHFAETLTLLSLMNKSYGNRFISKSPSWSWLLCLKGFGKPLNIYRRFNDRLMCCKTRKVINTNVTLATNNWIVGLRNSQSINRSANCIIQWDNFHNNIKLCPIINWNISSMLVSLIANNIAYNSLYDVGYKSIGCSLCTRVVRYGEMVRAGRWWWEDVKASLSECGLHKH